MNIAERVESIVSECDTVTKFRYHMRKIRDKMNPMLRIIINKLGKRNNLHYYLQHNVNNDIKDYIDNNESLYLQICSELQSYTSTGKIGKLLKMIKDNSEFDFNTFIYYNAIIYNIWVKCSGDESEEDCRLYSLELDDNKCECELYFREKCKFISEPNHILTRYFGGIYDCSSTFDMSL